MISINFLSFLNGKLLWQGGTEKSSMHWVAACDTIASRIPGRALWVNGARAHKSVSVSGCQCRVNTIHTPHPFPSQRTTSGQPSGADCPAGSKMRGKGSVWDGGGVEGLINSRGKKKKKTVMWEWTVKWGCKIRGVLWASRGGVFTIISIKGTLPEAKLATRGV